MRGVSQSMCRAAVEFFSDNSSKQRNANLRRTDNLRGMNTAARMVLLNYEDVDSPVGRLRLIASGNALVGIQFEHGRDAARSPAGMRNATSTVLERARLQ